MERRFFSGNTLEQAVMAAARHFGLEPDRVAYVKREKKHGFLRLGKRVVVEVDPAAPERPAPREGGPKLIEPSPIPVAEEIDLRGDSRGARIPVREARTDDAEDDDAVDDDAVDDFDEDDFDEDDEFEDPLVEGEAAPEDLDDAAALERAIGKIVDFLKLDIAWNVQESEEGFEVNFLGDDAETLLDNEGRLLEAIEHLLPRLARGWIDHGFPVKVDCEGYRGAREEELQGMARDAADEAAASQQPVRLEPMNPADRRVVHLVLVDDPRVETESEGDGYLKQVRIQPR